MAVSVSDSFPVKQQRGASAPYNKNSYTGIIQDVLGGNQLSLLRDEAQGRMGYCTQRHAANCAVAGMMMTSIITTEHLYEIL